MLFVITSCRITKYVPKNKFLLDRNNIIIKKQDNLGVSKHKNIDNYEMKDILKQKPNKKTLGKIRLHLRIYNLSNKKRIERRKIVQSNKAKKKNKKIDYKNKKRKIKIQKKNNRLKQKGIKKDTVYPIIVFKNKPYIEPKLTFGERIRNSGEKPIVIDSTKTVTSAKQLSYYLINKGYFNNNVKFKIKEYPDTLVKKDKIKIKNKRKANRGEVDYLVTLGKPYKIRNIKYNTNDTLLLKYIDSIESNSYISKNQIYDSEKLNKERERITSFLMNNGYKFFNKEFIYFKLDSNLNSNQLDIELRIQNYKYKDPIYDTIKEQNHSQYNVMKVEIYPDVKLKNKKEIYTDTSYFTKNISIVSGKKLSFKPKLLYNSIKFEEGELYNHKKVIATYKTFSSLGTFKSTSIEFDTLDNGCNDLVAKIRLSPTKMQSFTVATDGTHRNGLLGIEGRLAYSHRNIFKGAEKLQISLSGGLEMQRLLVDKEKQAQDGIEEVIDNFSNFNTIEFGPSISLTIPRFLFLGKLFSKAYNPKTEFSGVINYQKRPDFTRNKENFSFGYVWHEKTPITYRFYPVNISAIKLNKSTAFQQKINELNDKLLAASYQDHIISSSRFSFTYNGQDIKKKQRSQYYFQSIFETAGNSLRAIYKLTNQPLNNENAYEFLGIRFAQFAKISTDFRYYNNVTNKIRVVTRFYGGVGMPLKNLNKALPFEKSFYSGGANGMRSWKARTLGPGAYYDSTRSFDKIGDIKLETNIEIRFPISSWIEGATFIDAGNIWLINQDSLRAGGHFTTQNFIQEIGIGAGLGLRMDLSFFIIRLDFALPIRNPALPIKQRWIGYKRLYEYSGYEDNSIRRDFFPWQFNLGIGYPF